MVREAGGVVSSLSGGEPDLSDPQFVAAGTATLHREISQLLGCTAC